MTTSTSSRLERDFFDYLQEAMKQAVGKAFDKAIAEAVKEAESKRDEVVAGVALSLSSWMTMENMGRTLRIEIAKPVKDNPDGN